MSYIDTNNFSFLVAAGLVPGVSGVNKYGRATDCDSGVATDIWDRANATDAQPIWVAPTAARIHAIVSTSASDDGSPVGVGARTLRVYGLQTWGSAESFEDVVLNGVGPVNTGNSYVIIHRMRVLTCGASGPNVGKITATAAVNGTVTAQIIAGRGQSQMAIYGVPSTKTLLVHDFYTSVLRANLGATNVAVDIGLLFSTDVVNQPNIWTVKHTSGVVMLGSSNAVKPFDPLNAIAGPGILKLQATAGANNIDMSGGFNGYLRTN